MQCNTLNIKTTLKQVWLYFIPRTTWPGYAGTTSNLQIVLNTPQNSQLKSPLKSSRTKKYLPNFPTQKNPVIENSKPKKILQSPPSIEIQSTPPPPDVCNSFVSRNCTGMAGSTSGKCLVWSICKDLNSTLISCTK